MSATCDLLHELIETSAISSSGIFIMQICSSTQFAAKYIEVHLWQRLLLKYMT